MHSKKLEGLKKNLALTRIQKEIIVGKLLGDGHLESSNKGMTYRLKVEHSIKQKDYVDWLYGQFKEWTNIAPKMKRRYSKFPNESAGIFDKYGFTTYSHGSFRFYGKQFYPKKKKIIPKMINKLLTPLSIAIWYLDDGSFKSEKHKTFIIHNHAYQKKDLKIAQKALQKFGIKTNLHKQNRKDGLYWRIYVLSESAGIFKKLIEPTINQIPSMKYKLGNNLPKE